MAIPSRTLTVLVVEDSESKRQSIQSVLERELPGVEIHHANSVRSGIDAVVELSPDFVIADMSLPTFDIKNRERGGSPRPFGGFEIFETLDRHGIVIPVLVVTSYESITDGENSMGISELKSHLEKDYPSIFSGIVHFDSTYATWERKLSEFLKDSIGK